MPPTSPSPVPQDLGAAIDDVSASTRQYIWHNHGILFGTLTALCVSLSAIISLALYEAYSLHLGDFDARSIIWPVLPLGAVWITYQFFYAHVQHLFVQQLAAAIGYSYSSFAPNNTVAGTFFNLGNSSTLGDVMEGTLKNKPVRIFTYTYVTGSGKTRETHTYTVFEMQYGLPLPHILMNLPILFIPENMEPVELEGGFEEHFKLYTPKGMQMEVREVFQPDVMEDIMKSLSSFSLEIAEGTVYLMKKGAFTKKQTFLDMRSAVENLFEDILPGLATVARDARAQA